MMADTMDRVPAHTPRHLNARIQRAIEERIRWYALRLPEPGGLAAIDRRLRELEEEWDIERVLEANAASISLLGVTASAALDDRRWLLLPAAVAGFLLQHAVQGWCPPVSVFRRLGVRTAAEIERERYALKALRGDFDDLPADGAGRARESLRGVRLEQDTRPRRPSSGATPLPRPPVVGLDRGHVAGNGAAGAPLSGSTPSGERSIMTKRMPPVPPAGRSPKGPGNQAEPPASSGGGAANEPPDNLKEQDRQGNVKQNTTNQGYQQDR